MRIGLDEWSIHHLDISGLEKLDLVEKLGLEGIQFADARQISRQLDHGLIREVGEEARRRNLYLEMGIPGLNILRPSAKALEAGKGDFVEGHRALLRAAAAAGVTVIRTFVGGPGDRVRRYPEWPIQLQGATQLAKTLGAYARELGLQLAFETHADVTSFELLRLIEEAGEDVAKVCLDTGNLPIGLEDPLEATRRLAPYVIATHLKDSIVFFSESGLVAQCRSVGTGIVQVKEILSTLMAYNPDINLSIEDHEGLYPIDIFKPGWQVHHPDVQPEELAFLIQQARLCERRIESGEIPHPDALEAIPWADQAEQRIRSGYAFVRKTLEEVTV